MDGEQKDAERPEPQDEPGPMSVEERQQQCLDALREVATSYGMRIAASTVERRVQGGSRLIDATWGVVPVMDS